MYRQICSLSPNHRVMLTFLVSKNTIISQLLEKRPSQGQLWNNLLRNIHEITSRFIKTIERTKFSY